MNGPSPPAPVQESSGATVEDVYNAYRFILGREPDPAMTGVGQPMFTLVRGMFDSEECRQFVRTPILLGNHFTHERFAGAPTETQKAWAAARLPTPPDMAQSILAAKDWRSVLRILMLGLEGDSGAGITTRLDEVAKFPVESNDVIQAYRLILGREVESEGAINSRVGAEFINLIVGLLASEEFRANTVAKIVGGSFDDPTRALPLSTLQWVRVRFGVEASVETTRLDGLAAVLRAPMIAVALAKPGVPLGWSPSTLAQFIDAPLDPEYDNGQVHQTPASRLQTTSTGVEILSSADIVLEANTFVFTSADPHFIFRLESEAIAGTRAVELNFAVAGARRRAQGALYVDYGQGFSQTLMIRLTPHGRRQYGVLLLEPARVRYLRWDPDEMEGRAVIADVVVRPVTMGELKDKLGDLSAAELIDGLATGDTGGQPVLFDLSRQITERFYGHAGADGSDYCGWIEENEPSPRDAQRLWAARLAELSATPLISVLVPTYETPPDLLREMIESVLAQVYPHWELCIVDDASGAPHVREIIEGYMAEEPRIKAAFRPVNGHISEASNTGLQLVEAEWLALLDHDDVLTPNALLEVAAEIEAHPDAEFIYSDEDKLDARGGRFSPFFKPDFSPELFRAQNYLNHLSVHRTANVRAVGGWRKGFEGSQDYDLNLRTLERMDPARVRHIPKVLYHWRAVEGSTALAVDQKDYAFTAGLHALEDHVDRMGWAAKVEPIADLPFYRFRYSVPSPAPLVSLIVPTRDRAALLEACIGSVLERTIYDPYEILIIDNGSLEQDTFILLNALTQNNQVRVINIPGPFNYSKINNDAVRQCNGDIICLLNNDVEVINSDWLREMASWAAQPRIGCVGGKLYYPNDTIQHAGVTMGLGGVAGHPHKHRHRSDPGYFGRVAVSHDVSAVTGACLMVRRDIYEKVGGLDERLQVAFNDVDFCLRVQAEGYRNIFTPFAELYHHESISRGADEEPAKRSRFISEIDLMHEMWGSKINIDPYYSPNLSLERDDYTIK